MKRSLLTLLYILFSTLPALAATKSYKELTHWDNDRLQRAAISYMDRHQQPDSALLCLSIIVSRSEMGKDEAYSRINSTSLMLMGYIYMSFIVDYGRAYSYLLRAQDISQKANYPDVLSSVYINLGILSYMENVIFSERYFDTKAIGYYRKALRISLDNGLSQNIALSFLNMASLAVMSGRASIVLADARLVKEAYAKGGYPNSDYLLHVVSGIEALAAGHYAAAETSFEASSRHVRVHNAIDSLRYVITSLGYASAACRKDERYADAIRHLHRALRLASANRLTDEMMEVYNELAQNYSMAGRKALAREYRYRYLEAKNSFVKSSHLHHVAQEKFESEMNANNALLKASLLRQQRMATALAVAMAVALVIASLLYVMFRMYRKQKSYAETVYKKNVELMGLRTEKYTSSGLDEGGKQELTQRIGCIMDDVETISAPDFSLQQLSERVGSNSRYVSQVINECYGCNFKALLNERRVKEACRRMADLNHFGHVTLDAIAASVGFRSRSNFLNVFKKITGLSPSEFQRYAREKTAGGGGKD